MIHSVDKSGHLPKRMGCYLVLVHEVIHRSIHQGATDGVCRLLEDVMESLDAVAFPHSLEFQNGSVVLETQCCLTP